MKDNMMMKRWAWILVMIPVMWGWLQLVISADRLFAWEYSSKYPRPTAADYTRAAVVFWGALLTPAIIGLATAIVAFRRKYAPRWPVLELCIVAFAYVSSYAGLSLYKGLWRYGDDVVTGGYVLVGGAVVVALLDLGACLRQHFWGRAAISALALCGGMSYLAWLNAVILYLDT